MANARYRNRARHCQATCWRGTEMGAASSGSGGGDSARNLMRRSGDGAHNNARETHATRRYMRARKRVHTGTHAHTHVHKLLARTCTHRHAHADTRTHTHRHAHTHTQQKITHQTSTAQIDTHRISIHLHAHEGIFSNEPPAFFIPLN